MLATNGTIWVDDEPAKLTKNERQRAYEQKTKSAANIKYKQANTISVGLRFFKNTENELIEHILAQPNKNGYIKELIRQDMAKKQG